MSRKGIDTLFYLENYLISQKQRHLLILDLITNRFIATKLRRFESDREHHLFFFLFLTTYAYNEPYYVRHKLESIKNRNLTLHIKKTKKRCRQ